MSSTWSFVVPFFVYLLSAMVYLVLQRKPFEAPVVWSFGENKKDVELFYSGVNASKLPVNCCWVVDQWAVNGSERERELLCTHAQRNHGLTENPSDTSTAISVTKWSFRHCHSKLYFFRRYFFSKTWKQMNLMKIIVLKGISSEWRQKWKLCYMCI